MLLVYMASFYEHAVPGFLANGWPVTKDRGLRQVGPLSILPAYLL